MRGLKFFSVSTFWFFLLLFAVFSVKLLIMEI